MLPERIESVESHLRRFVRQRYHLDLGRLTVETPPRVEFGDLAFPLAFELAKTLRRSPQEIAREIAETAQMPAHVDRAETAGSGFINVFFDRPSFLRDLCQWLGRPDPSPSGEKCIVEHTNINPNKAAHIGHLRNAVLGDALVRLLRAMGRVVEVQNYIDNTGVQVADVVVGFQQFRKWTLDRVGQVEEPFDHYCWDLYAQVSKWYAEDDSRLGYRQQVLREIEKGEGETAQLADHVAMRIVKAHLKTMLRIGVVYDVLPRESEILHLKFWEQALERLKRRQAISYAEKGPHKGCWVMTLPEEDGQPADEKIIVRSNGTVTYVGKDIAYQLWKFGLLGRTFHYRPFYRYQDGKTVWVTSARPFPNPAPRFGYGARVYNVIDVRQSYLQRVVVQGLRNLGFGEEADRSTHFSYEMVALSPQCCADMRITLSEEERKKPYIEVSGRRGLGVKADDFINKLIERTLQEVRSRQPDLAGETQQRIGTQIAVGALRYFLLKYTRNSVIAFDFAEALSFEGETGPYLQYSVVRADNIFRKLAQRNPDWHYGRWVEERSGLWDKPSQLSRLLADDEIWSLLLSTARIEQTMAQSLKALEMSHLAKHAFTLAQCFNLFYHKHHILSEPNADRRNFHLMIADIARQGLLKILAILRIEVPEKM
ncbi:MAG: arginine--tRNA ligase [Acidobacteriota bacterium]